MCSDFTQKQSKLKNGIFANCEENACGLVMLRTASADLACWRAPAHCSFQYTLPPKTLSMSTIAIYNKNRRPFALKPISNPSSQLLPPLPPSPLPHAPIHHIPRNTISYQIHDHPQLLHILIPRLIIKEQHLIIAQPRLFLQPCEMRSLRSYWPPIEHTPTPSAQRT